MLHNHKEPLKEKNDKSFTGSHFKTLCRWIKTFQSYYYSDRFKRNVGEMKGVNGRMTNMVYWMCLLLCPFSSSIHFYKIRFWQFVIAAPQLSAIWFLFLTVSSPGVCCLSDMIMSFEIKQVFSPAQIWISHPFPSDGYSAFLSLSTAPKHKWCMCTAYLQWSWWWRSALRGWPAHQQGSCSGTLGWCLPDSACCPVHKHNRSCGYPKFSSS